MCALPTTSLNHLKAHELSHTFLAAVRFQDGSKQKFHVNDVPDDLAIIRGLIAHELADHQPPVQVILLRTDGVASGELIQEKA